MGSQVRVVRSDMRPIPGDMYLTIVNGFRARQLGQGTRGGMHGFRCP